MTFNSNRLYILLIFCTSINACTKKEQGDKAVWKEVNRSLLLSNNLLNQEKELLLAYFDESLSSPITSTKAALWYPKAKLVEKYTSDVIEYINSIKLTMEREVGNDESCTNSIKEFFFKKGNGHVLHQKLAVYKKNIKQVDPLINSTLKNEPFLRAGERKEKEFIESYFANNTYPAVMALLNSFQQQLSVLENRLIKLLSEQWTNHWDEHYTSYSAIVAQSVKKVRVGEEVEIIAGAGAFQTRNTSISINGRKITLEEDGAAHYKFKIPNTNGKVAIPTRIELVDQEGKIQTITKDVEFLILN